MSFLCEAFPPDAGLRSYGASACAAVSADQAVLLEILCPEVALAMWLRPAPVDMARLVNPLPAGAPFRVKAEDEPDAAVASRP